MTKSTKHISSELLMKHKMGQSQQPEPKSEQPELQVQNPTDKSTGRRRTNSHKELSKLATHYKYPTP